MRERLGSARAGAEVATASGRDWRAKYSRRLAISDLLVLIWVVFGVQIAWFGFDTADVSVRGDILNLAVSYTAVSVLIIACWLVLLGIYGTRGYRVLGTGPEEYKLIANASIRLFGLLAIAAYLFRFDLARGYILIAFPLGGAVLIFSRWMWRQWLRGQRQNGAYSSRVVLLGSAESVSRIARELASEPHAGYLVVGACLPAETSIRHLPGTRIPVFESGLDSIQVALRATLADTVVVTSKHELPPARMRELSWSLEPGRQQLIVVPSLTDISGPRLHTRPVAGLPLIHVEMPRYEGGKQFAKRAFDICGSGALLVVTFPLMLILAALVRLTSVGPVFYLQERIGMKGDPFHMLKFRSMRVNADAELASLLKAQGTNGRPLFKVQDDPRLTRIGGFLRKYSLDEFPQLLNVFRGEMSLVGPRPQREGEVALYDSTAHRRLYVKPGMSGLWQVSGRSNLSWEDSIRLDLYYVENWSLAGDFVILWRTARAVIAPNGDAF